MKSGHDTGGPAFPMGPHHDCTGRTLRDWLAGQALPSAMVICQNDSRMGGISYPEHVARAAVTFADALIAELGK